MLVMMQNTLAKSRSLTLISAPICTAFNNLLSIQSWKAHDRHDKFTAIMTVWCPVYTHTHQADSAGAAHCSGLLSASAAARRGGAISTSRALQAKSYLYSLYRFILTHHAAWRNIKRVSVPYFQRRRNLFTFCSKNKITYHLHMTVDCHKNTLLFSFWLQHLKKSYVYYSTKMPITCQHNFVFTVSLITSQKC